MDLQEFQVNGGCEGCYFYVEVEEGRKECTFPWYDDCDERWNYGKNCDEISE